MMNPMRSVLLLLFTTSLSSAQDPTISVPPSSLPTAVERSPSPSLVLPSQNPTAAPTTSLEPITTNKPSHNAPLFTLSPTRNVCANNPRWEYEYWNFVRCQKLFLTCDFDRVQCSDYGTLGSARYNCCKCNPYCDGQCNDPIYLPQVQKDQTDCHSYNDGIIHNNIDDDGPKALVIVAACLVLVCCTVSLCHYNFRGLRSTRRDYHATRQTMTARRRLQRERNVTSQGLTEEERNHARYELFITKFLFQTVLQDKSNVTANDLRGSSASKFDEEHPRPDEEHPSATHLHVDDDDASAVGVEQVYFPRFLSSWRRPSASDECCICLECYAVGETICAPITTECDHVFHEGCINEWLKKNDKCPLCRVELLKDQTL